MKDQRLTLPLHQAKKVAHDLHTAMGLLDGIESNHKAAIMSLLLDATDVLIDCVKLGENGNNTPNANRD